MKRTLIAGTVFAAAALAGCNVSYAQNCYDVDYVAGCDASGDFNGDGIVDISDPVAALTYLFSGGPKPHSSVRFEVYAAMWEELNQSEFNLMAKWAELDSCTLEQWRLAKVAAQLLVTGQERCYDLAGAVIDCASADLPGQDAAIPHVAREEVNAGTQFLYPQRFVGWDNGWVSDNITGLTWNATAPVRMDWGSALRWCVALPGGWRLPNVAELQGIVDFGRGSPACDPAFAAVSDHYWTSTSCVGGGADWAWYVNFGVGDTVAKRKTTALYVRAVRGGRS